MLNTVTSYITFESIYLMANWGVLPFWLMLITIPNHGLTRVLAQSVIAPLLLSIAYVYVGYEIYLNGDIFSGFNLYLGLDNLYSLYSQEGFLLIFWLHFLSISLFIGSWIVRDSLKYYIPRIFTSISLIITYFSGPVGLVFYWFIRIFFAKKISFND